MSSSHAAVALAGVRFQREYKDIKHTHAGWMFQARMWREYAMALTYSSYRTSTGIGGAWVRHHLQAPKLLCIQIAKQCVRNAADVRTAQGKRLPL